MSSFQVRDREGSGLEVSPEGRNCPGQDFEARIGNKGERVYKFILDRGTDGRKILESG